MMEKREYQEEFLKKEDIVMELMQAMFASNSMSGPDCIATLMSHIIHMPVYTGTVNVPTNPNPKQTSKPKQDLSDGTITRIVVGMPFPGKPRYVRFKNVDGENSQHAGEMFDFTSVNDYLVRVCVKIMQTYGELPFKQAVFAPDNRAYADLHEYFTQNKNAHPEKKWVPILDDMWVVGDLDFIRAVALTQKLVKYFPEADHQFLVG